MTIADTPALPASVARGDWPEPHHLRLVAPDTPALERATVTMNDGSRVQGIFVRLNPGARMLEFRPDKGPAPQNIPFGDFRSLYLTRAVEVEPIPGPETHGEALTPSRSQRKCTVRFHGGTELSGDTVGIVARRFGLYLYMVNYGTNVLRWFVPSEAMEGYQLDQPLGQLLVEQKAASAAAVDAALARQRELRERRIGEYLLNDNLVAHDQLEEALLRQKTLRHLRLGDALVQQKIITEAERDAALERQRTDRRKPLGEILVEMNLVPPDTVRRVLVDQLGFPSVNLRRFQYEPNALKSISAEMAHQHCVMPLYRTESRVAVAMENPLAWETLQALEFYIGLKVDPVIAARDDLLKTIDQFYGTASEAKGGIRALVAELDASPPPAQEGLRHLDASESDHVLVRLVNKMITDALEQGASDIHIESRPDGRPSRVRLRIDGVLSAYAEIPSNFRAAIVSRLKIMAQMDIAERRRPQDGKINFAEFGTAAIELRVVTIPTAQGMEDVVLRLLSAPRAMSLAQLGLMPRVLEGLKSAVARPYGLVFVCGPTGSGKTTTLHSLLGHINSPERKIWTVEDPVEITQEGLCQVQVNARIGLGFVDVLRSFMRADPDVVMVGETRDAETARTVISASLTGHLVLSTMHTNSAAESVVRLLDFGLDPFNFSDALLAIVSQRLVRRLCPSCRKPRVASREELNALAKEYCREDPPPDAGEVVVGWLGRYANAEGGITLHGPHGCEHCDQSGYKGRLGVHELLIASPRIKALVQARASTAEVSGAAMAEGMLSLRQDGIEKVLQGHTDMRQIQAVCI